MFVHNLLNLTFTEKAGERRWKIQGKKYEIDKTLSSTEASSGTQHKGSNRHEQRNLQVLKGRRILG